MVITPHAVAGAVVGRPLSSAPIAVVAGMATHLVLDRIPHQDYSLDAIAFLTADTAVAALLTHRLSSANRTVMLAGAIGGVVPDVAQVIERVLGVNITRAAHRANHTTVVWPLWAGVSSQLGTVAVCVGALTLANRRRRAAGRPRPGVGHERTSAVEPPRRPCSAPPDPTRGPRGPVPSERVIRSSEMHTPIPRV